MAEAVETTEEVTTEETTETVETTVDVVDTTATENTATFPENWRDLMAGGDEKLSGVLSRYTSPSEVGKAVLSLRSKLASGEYKRSLPEDASAEEVAAWRKENGVPDDVAGYKIELPKGVELDEEDVPIVDSFKEFAHGKNWSNAQLNQAMEWYTSFQENVKTAQIEQDKEHNSAAVEALRAEWPGGEYKMNLNAGKEILGDFAEALFSARMQDGMLLGNHPGFRQWLAQTARTVSPEATLLPSGMNNLKGVDTRINEIETAMRTNRVAYDRDAAMQKEYLNLLEVREKLKK